MYATIDFHWDNCDAAGDDDSGIAAWVGLGSEVAPTVIVQVGIVSCREPYTILATVCRQFPNQLRYFFAYGGPFGLGPWGRDGGPATAGTHNYKVTRNTNGWYMFMPNGLTGFADASNAAVSCVEEGEQTVAQWDVERKDRGDSMGGPTTKTHYAEMQVSLLGSSTYFHLNWGASTGPCSKVDNTAPHNAACYDIVDQMYAWDD